MNAPNLKAETAFGSAFKSRKVGSSIPVDLWSYESKVYPRIDSAGMREEKSVEAKWQLGDGYNVALKVETLDKETLSNSRTIKPSTLIFRVNFWKDGEKPFFRVDTDNGFLHFHLIWNGKKVSDHIPLPEGEFSISQLISNAFEATRGFLIGKGTKILKGSDFEGFA